MRLSSFYRVTFSSKASVCPRDSWKSAELDAGHRGVLCLEVWGAGLEQGWFPKS